MKSTGPRGVTARPAVYSVRALPRPPQRGASEILRIASIIATSMAARLCSFSRLTSVTTDPGAGGDVARRHPVEREHQRVVPADLAAAEIGEVRPHRLVGLRDVVFQTISDHRTARAGVTTAPVNVEPVVPVSRTW